MTCWLLLVALVACCCLVLGSWFLLLGSWLLALLVLGVLGSWLSSLGSWFLAQGSCSMARRLLLVVVICWLTVVWGWWLVWLVDQLVVGGWLVHL